VQRNRQQVAPHWGPPSWSSCARSMGHSVRVIDDRPAAEGMARAEADALITDRPGKFLVVQVADCQPILMYDPVRRVWPTCIAAGGEVWPASSDALWKFCRPVSAARRGICWWGSGRRWAPAAPNSSLPRRDPALAVGLPARRGGTSISGHEPGSAERGRCA